MQQATPPGIEKQMGRTEDHGVVRPSAWARAAAVALALVLAFHFAATFLWVAPAGPLQDAVAPVLDRYMLPYFRQGWMLFGPDPIDGDSTLLVRARWTDRSNGRRVSDWVNVTKREWSGVLHDPLHPRSAVGTDELSRILSEDHDNLSDKQASIAGRDYSQSGWQQLRADLSAQKGADSNQLESYLRRELATAAFATQYAYAWWGPSVGAVQFQVKYTPVPDFKDRADKNVQPKSDFTYFGWRPTTVFDGQSQDYFAETVRRGDR